MNTNKILLTLSILAVVAACSPDRAQRETLQDETLQDETLAPSGASGQDDEHAIEAAVEAVNEAANTLAIETQTGVSGANSDGKGSDVITVHKTATCGCCSGWVDHLKREGFGVKVIDHTDLNKTKENMGVPQHLYSCHTGEVNGLFVEGHVPAQDIREMIDLAKNDDGIDGIAVPGMPMGSPGMEAGGQTQPYDVILVAGQEESVLNSHGKR